MLKWLIVEFFARLAGGIMPKDARHRYISPHGVAYSIIVEPVAGCLNIVEVTLHGDPVIPRTSLPGLTLLVRPTALRVGAAIRYLLWRADLESARMEKLEEAFEVAEVNQEPEIMTPQLVEAVKEEVERLTQPSAEELALD